MKVYLQNREWARFGVCQFLPVLASGCFFPAFSNFLDCMAAKYPAEYSSGSHPADSSLPAANLC